LGTVFRKGKRKGDFQDAAAHHGVE